MTQEAMKEKIEALNNDEAFAEKVKACETAEAICALYAEKGIEITPEELDAAIDAMNADESKEFSEDDLDGVAGGIFISGGAFLAWSIAYSCVTLQSAYTLGRMNRKRR